MPASCDAGSPTGLSGEHLRVGARIGGEDAGRTRLRVICEADTTPRWSSRARMCQSSGRGSTRCYAARMPGWWRDTEPGELFVTVPSEASEERSRRIIMERASPSSEDVTDMKRPGRGMTIGYVADGSVAPIRRKRGRRSPSGHSTGATKSSSMRTLMG
jgi:hypothetical protein